MLTHVHCYQENENWYMSLDKMTLKQWIKWKIHQFKRFSIRFRICDMIRGKHHTLRNGLVASKMILQDYCSGLITSRGDIYNSIYTVLSALNYIECGRRSIDFDGKYLKRFKVIDWIYRGTLSSNLDLENYIVRHAWLWKDIADSESVYDDRYLRFLCEILIANINWIFSH